MQDITKKKIASAICTVVVILIAAAYLGVILSAMLTEKLGSFLLTLFLLAYGGVILAIILGVIAALRQRLREIDAGEEEDAKQY